MSEKLLMQLEMARSETLTKLNELFRQRTQVKEQLEDIEVQLQFGRGTMNGLERAQKIIQDLDKSEEFEKAKDERIARLAKEKAEAAKSLGMTEQADG